MCLYGGKLRYDPGLILTFLNIFSEGTSSKPIFVKPPWEVGGDFMKLV